MDSCIVAAARRTGFRRVRGRGRRPRRCIAGHTCARTARAVVQRRGRNVDMSACARVSRMSTACAMAILLSAASAAAQETRSTILGTVRDPSGGVLPGASIVVANEDTNVSNETVSNEHGAFEVTYLIPGTYRIAVSVVGFKKFTRTGLPLAVNARVEVPVVLEVGSVSDEVTVTAEAPLLETATASASSTLTNRQVNSLPVFGNSALLLARSVPGIQWTGQPNYLGLHSNVGASAISARGGTGRQAISPD